MTTPFSSLPTVDLSILSLPDPTSEDLLALSDRLYQVFTTTGFAYLVHPPLSFSHDEVFGLAKDFFRLRDEEKMRLAKRTFVAENRNTYRGYFPLQAGQADNLKEGFEMGPAESPASPSRTSSAVQQNFDLSELNVWPSEASFPSGRAKLERLHSELQKLASELLCLLAVALGKPVDYFASYLVDSLSTLRLLHYPPQLSPPTTTTKEGENDEDDDEGVRLCCTPHTDSGILTLLHQDQSGGLEIQNSENKWIPAPYLPDSLVVNIGDLMAEISGGKFVATRHRVRIGPSPNPSPPKDGPAGAQTARTGRFSVPFFFEPGEHCVVLGGVDGLPGTVVKYGDFVRRKMGMWVEYQDSSSAGVLEKDVSSRRSGLDMVGVVGGAGGGAGVVPVVKVVS